MKFPRNRGCSKWSVNDSKEERLSQGSFLSENTVAKVIQGSGTRVRTRRTVQVITDFSHAHSVAANFLDRQFDQSIGPNQIWSMASQMTKELVHRQKYETRASARHNIFEYIEEFYHRDRLRSSLRFQRLEMFEQAV